MTIQEQAERVAELRADLVRLRVRAEPLREYVSGEESNAAGMICTKIDEALLWLHAYKNGGAA